MGLFCVLSGICNDNFSYCSCNILYFKFVISKSRSFPASLYDADSAHHIINKIIFLWTFANVHKNIILLII